MTYRSPAGGLTPRRPRAPCSRCWGRKDAVPIVDSMDVMASVLRASAFERLGDVAQAAQVLAELPDPRMLDAVRANYPALSLCPQAGAAFTSTEQRQGAKRAAAGASRVGSLVGGILALVGGAMTVAALGIGASVDWGNPAVFINGALGLGFVVVGLFIFTRARVAGKRAAWLRVNGLSLRARIVDARATGTMVNDVPVMRFTLQVRGPHGPYVASLQRPVPG